jgi:hypothetical protein
MAQAHFHGSFDGGKYKISIGLSIYMWEEGGVNFVYAPALDITGYGNSEEEAKRSFEITLSEFLKYTNNKQTFYDELEHLGWSVNRRKRRVHAPEFEEMLEDNESLKEVLNKGGVRRERRSVELAL